MKKVYKMALALLLLLSLAPFAFSSQKGPLYIKSAEVYTRSGSQGVAADVRVCSRVKESVKFVLKAENLTIGTHYKRNFKTTGLGCNTYNLKFKTPFSTAGNDGDEIVFNLTSIKDENGRRYANSEDYLFTTEDRDPTSSLYGDQTGEDGDYEFSVGDFFTHEPTGVRMKVTGYDGKQVDVLISGLRWGEVKKFTIYKGYSKRIVAGDGKSTRLKITHVGRGENGGVSMIVETY